MKTGIILVALLAMASGTAFAKEAKSKRKPSSTVCEQEVKDAATKAFKKKYPKDNEVYQVVADIQSHKGNTYHYLVDMLDGVSDGASSTEFSVGSFKVTVHTSGGNCEVEDPEFVPNSR